MNRLYVVEATPTITGAMADHLLRVRPSGIENLARQLTTGSIVGSGTVSNRGPDGGPGKPVADGGVGYSCLAEVRTIETIQHGKPADA